jgi:hypothetical protein
MSKVGETIRNKRLASSLEISDVAKILKIKKEYIIAMEEENSAIFSSNAYYSGYLKQYLKLLQLNNISLEQIALEQKLSINVPSPSFEPGVLFFIALIIFNILLYNYCNSLITINLPDPITLENPRCSEQPAE